LCDGNKVRAMTCGHSGIFLCFYYTPLLFPLFFFVVIITIIIATLPPFPNLAFLRILTRNQSPFVLSLKAAVYTAAVLHRFTLSYVCVALDLDLVFSCQK
jgi:hypothetical protein